MYDKKLKICNHAYAVDCKKESLKAAPTRITTAATATATTKLTTASVIIKPTITKTIPTTFEKTDPCLKKGLGINPRDAMISLDPQCEESLVLTKKELLKAAPTKTETVKIPSTGKTDPSNKTDPSPCLKKGIGINPRDAIIDLDHNCEENLAVNKSESGPANPLPPCKLDIRYGDPESDITFDTTKCDPNLPMN